LERSDAGAAPVLALANVVTGYGKRRVLEDVSLTVNAGEAIALIGHNGAGKTTMLQTMFGLQPLWGGRIVVDRSSLGPRHSAADAVHLGMAMIPAERFVFPDLTILENLRVSARTLSPAARDAQLTAAFSDFPILRERQSQLAGTLSGGQQRMVSLAMALMSRPRLLLLDEPSLGLSPAITEQMVARLNTLVKSRMTVVLVEQNIPVALAVASRVYVLRSGRIIVEETSDELRARGRENWWKLF
jgi:branched-chain amino acid transport system ATP-binding protein